MSTAARIARLAELQAALRGEVAGFGEPGYKRQYHAELSPSGWHLGHSIYIENHWQRQAQPALPPVAATMERLYTPQYSPKATRGRCLPELPALLDWAVRCQQRNLEGLQQLAEASRHPLLEHGFLLNMLLQHHAQHCETVRMVRAQYLLHMRRQAAAAPVATVAPAMAPVTMVRLAGGDYSIGTPEHAGPYDNEHPRHMVRLEALHVASRPASNTEYLEFMEAGGYQRQQWWSPQAWQWRQRLGVEAPGYWLRGDHGDWLTLAPTGLCTIQPQAPVCGLSHHEASAFAAWQGGRLPHEYEWEAAASGGLLQDTGEVWEWCRNPLHPYPGFRPYPYEGYSVPYFDRRHYVLRGGSRYTETEIRRPSFRNYYLPDTRYLYAGVRTVWD